MYESAWQKTIDSDAALQLAVGAKHVFVSGAKTRLTAMNAADGTEAWAKDLPSEVRLATGGGLLFVASGEQLHALDEATGSVRWTAAIPGATTGPTWANGFVVFASGPELVAFRSVDGSEVWRRHVGTETAQPVLVAEGHVFAVLASQTIVILDFVTGAPRNRILLGAVPGELAGAGDRLYFGADDGVVYSYRVRREDPDWHFPNDVNTVGAPVIDERCVYVSMMDNSVRAFRRGPGSSCWSPRVLKGRPASGPMIAGNYLVVPLTTGELILLNIKDGKLVPTAPPGDGAPPVPSAATLQAVAASPDASTVFIVTVGSNQQRVLTAHRRK